jgi:hypothetical protein
MPAGNIYSHMLWSRSQPAGRVSVTIGNKLGGWAYAEVQLARLVGGGSAWAFISGVRQQLAIDVVGNGLYDGPGDAPIGRWYHDCLSVTFTLWTLYSEAAALAKVTPWE